MTKKSSKAREISNTLASSIKDFTTGNYKKSVSEASRVLELDPSNIDAALILSKSLLELRAFKDALSALEKWESDPRVKDALEIARRCHQEHLTGEFNFAEMLREAQQTSRIMHGDYVSPDIGLSYIKNTELRGVHALKDLKRGTLILAEKALVSVFPSDPPFNYPRFDRYYETKARPEESPMIAKLIQKTLYSIYYHNIGSHIINLHDLTRERLEQMEGRKYPDYDRDSIDVPLQWDYKQVKKYYSSVPKGLACTQIDNAVRGNQYKADRLGLSQTLEAYRHLTKTGLIFYDKDTSSAQGLYYALSFINHHCIGNCDRVFIGDMVFLRTIADIPAGTELTVPYWSSLFSLPVRNDYADAYIFTCRCSLCRYQTRNKQKLEVSELFNKKFRLDYSITVDKMVGMLNALKKVYGFGMEIDKPLSQYHTRSSVLSGNTTQTNLLTYLSATGDLYQTLVTRSAAARQFSEAANYRAEAYAIAVEAGVNPGMLFVNAFEVVCLLHRIRGGDNSVVAVWIDEAKMRLKEIYFGDEKVWDILIAPVLKDILVLG
jgi:SET domain